MLKIRFSLFLSLLNLCCTVPACELNKAHSEKEQSLLYLSELPHEISRNIIEYLPCLHEEKEHIKNNLATLKYSLNLPTNIIKNIESYSQTYQDSDNFNYLARVFGLSQEGADRLCKAFFKHLKQSLYGDSVIDKQLLKKLLCKHFKTAKDTTLFEKLNRSASSLKTYYPAHKLIQKLISKKITFNELNTTLKHIYLYYEKQKDMKLLDDFTQKSNEEIVSHYTKEEFEKAINTIKKTYSLKNAMLISSLHNIRRDFIQPQYTLFADLIPIIISLFFIQNVFVEELFWASNIDLILNLADSYLINQKISNNIFKICSKIINSIVKYDNFDFRIYEIIRIYEIKRLYNNE